MKGHEDVNKWTHFPRDCPFVRRIHRSPVKSPHKGQWRGALMFPLISIWINGWVNNHEPGDLRRHRGHYDVIVMNYPMTDGFPSHRVCNAGIISITWRLHPLPTGLPRLDDNWEIREKKSSITVYDYITYSRRMGLSGFFCYSCITRYIVCLPSCHGVDRGRTQKNPGKNQSKSNHMCI